jgi:TRAP-type C4-dicarboxylate transport system permease small subunit
MLDQRPASLVRRLLEAACFVLILSFVVVVGLAVLFRYGLNASPPWSEEAIRFSLFWCILMGAVLVTMTTAACASRRSSRRSPPPWRVPAGSPRIR